MEPSESRKPSNEERLEQIIADYLQAAQSGSAPDRDALLQQHPDLADELRAFFADHDRMQAVAQPLRPAEHEENDIADEATLPPRDGVEEPTVVPAEQSTGAPPVGTKVRYFGDYELLEEIARGGMGVVYKARQVKLNRVVALKMILAGQFASEADVGRFYTEAEAAANLDHPGIVPIFEVGEHEGQHFFSMGYVDGQSLATKLADGPLPPLQAAELIKQVAEAVGYAHDKGVIHRDLKPANILLKGSPEQRDSSSPPPSSLNPQPVITDFGLAKRVQGDSGMTATGQVLGTPSYMPPEQAAGRIDQVREPADVYALGAVLYATLTGRPPFQADNPLDTLLQVLEREPVSPRQLNPGVPRDLETICLKCLQKERRRRYGSAHELVDDLKRFLRGEPIQARPVGRMERTSKWVRRHPAVCALVVLVVVSLVAGTTVSTLFGVQASRNAEKYRTQFHRSETLAGDLSLALKQQTAETQRANGLLYAAQIARAQSYWNENNVVAALEMLISCRRECRGWEHDYLYTLFTGLNQQTLGGHSLTVSCVAFSPDGMRILSGSYDKTLKLWDMATGRELRTFAGHMNPVTSVAFSADGTRIVSGSPKSAIVWNAENGQQILARNGQSSPVAYSSDGNWIASGDASRENWLHVWDADTGEDILTCKGHKYDLMGVAFSPIGDLIATCSFDALKVWDAKTGDELLTLQPSTFPSVKGPILNGALCVAFSPNGKQIVSGRRKIRLWDVESVAQKSSLNGHANIVSSVAFSPDGTRIVSGSAVLGGGDVKVWDATSGEELLSFKGHTNGVMSVAYSPDGQSIVSGSGNGTATDRGEVKVWDAVNGQHPITLSGHRYPVTSIAFSPDGRFIAGGSERLIVWDARTRQQTLNTYRHSAPIRCVAFSPDGKWIVSASDDKTLRVCDVASGEERLVLNGHSAGVGGAAFSPDGTRIVSGSYDKTLKVWDADDGEVSLTLKGHQQPVSTVAFSPNGEWIVSGAGGSDKRANAQPGEVKVWDSATGQPKFRLTGLTLPIKQVLFSPDGKWIAGSARTALTGEIRVWNAATGQAVFTYDEGNTRSVGGVAFSPDGTRLVTAYDSTLSMWDARSGQQTLTLANVNVGVGAVAFSPDGRSIATGGGGVKLWDASVSHPMPEQ